MNENIDLIKILDGCPVGTEFYHVVYGKVWFDDISNDYSDDSCYITFSSLVEPLTIISVTKKGTFSARYDGECLIFPSKDQRDWSKFERFWDKSKQEKFDISTFQPFDKVLVRNRICDCWNAFPFSHMIKRRAICCDFSWEQCIPYNDDTKHLVGTKNDCPEYYKWWEE